LKEVTEVKILLLIVHFIITVLLIGGILIQTSRSEGLGGMGGGSDTVFRGSSAKGFEALVEKWMVYLAYAFLGSSLLSYIVVF